MDETDEFVKIDVTELKQKTFTDVNAIRDAVNETFGPQNIKLISKRAERHYPNGYCVYVLYCNRCQKRKPTYQCSKQYKKRSTNCPFTLKFTKNEGEDYSLTGGIFLHNHDLTTPVLDTEVLAELDKIDPVYAKPAQIKRLICQKLGKDVSYAQLAYEMSKRKQLQPNPICLGKRPRRSREQRLADCTIREEYDEVIYSSQQNEEKII